MFGVGKVERSDGKCSERRGVKGRSFGGDRGTTFMFLIKRGGRRR